MRIRQIKPGIMSNEDIAELGPYAYILFTGLWMIADREGRLENRPQKIKALVMPLWDAVPWREVENLVEKLCEKGMLRAYEVGGKPYLVICNWHKHQYNDPREAQSKLPPPPPDAHRVNGHATTTCSDTVELPCKDTVITASSPVGVGLSGAGCLVVERAREKPNGSTEENPPTPTPPKTKATPPHAERAAASPEMKRKPATRAPSTTRHKAEDVTLIRESLTQLAQATNMPPPDDGIITRVLDAAGGASGDDIHAVLVALWKRNKFRAMYSWGFVPLVISQVYKAA